MPRDFLADLLRGAYRDPDDGEIVDPGVRSVVIGEGLAGHEVALLQNLGLGQKLVVVSDEITHEVLGARVEDTLSGEFVVQGLVLEGRVHADEATVAVIVDAAGSDADALIAVGSGTINDLCKAAAGRTGRPYAVFGTAPSMNGYTSATASITIGGLKSTVRARPPAGVFLDVGVLAAAPARMIRAGLAECLARSTAQADWLLAHLLLDQPYLTAPFELLGDDEAAVVAGAAGLVSGDLEAMTRLARTLVLSGIGMTIAGSSNPASQGEHLISHYMDMMRPAHIDAPYHGEQIAVTTLFMAELQERVLVRTEPPRLLATATSHDDVVAHFGAELGELCWHELARKRLTGARVDELNSRLRGRWDTIRQIIAAVGRPAGELRDALVRAAAPTQPGDLGWTEAQFQQACWHAREIRDRFTFLDLAADSGLLDRPHPHGDAAVSVS